MKAESKAADLDLPGAAWTMIGHVQGNKVEDVLAFTCEVQSLDRLSLARALERGFQAQGRGMDMLIQVQTADEASKFGLAAGDVPAFLADIRSLGTLHVRGFMTLATNTLDQAEIRRCFGALREVRRCAMQDGVDGAAMTCLSMGMSSDFELAVEEGATCVRLGEAVFGKRSFRPPGGSWVHSLVTG